MFDVIIIGGGVVGGLLLRELTKYDVRVALLEKESDVCMGASKANSGIVHAGYDAQPNSLKAKFNVLGNKMMEEVCRQLGVKFRRNGSLVVAFTNEEVKILQELKARGEQNGVKALQILSQKELFALEPQVSKSACAALYAPSGGIVNPYGLTIAAIGNAMDNGAALYTDFEVCKVEGEFPCFTLTAKDCRQVRGKCVVNCAGLQGGKIAALFGDNGYDVKARKGEYVLLDKREDFVKHTLFRTPTKKGKGILVTPTVDGNVLLGPTSEEVDIADRDTTQKGLTAVLDGAKILCEKIPMRSVITSFAGLRAYTERRDFIIEESEKKGAVHCIGIESPGLTASPAIAKYVVETFLSQRIDLVENKRFNGGREKEYFFKDLSKEEQNKLIQRDPAYGKIVCRCEQITEGEIRKALKTNPPARDIDGIKRRTRSGMGRCQGGFCQPRIAELLAEELSIPLEEVTKKGKASKLLTGVLK